MALVRPLGFPSKLRRRGSATLSHRAATLWGFHFLPYPGCYTLVKTKKYHSHAANITRSVTVSARTVEQRLPHAQRKPNGNGSSSCKYSDPIFFRKVCNLDYYFSKQLITTRFCGSLLHFSLTYLVKIRRLSNINGVKHYNSSRQYFTGVCLK